MTAELIHHVRTQLIAEGNEPTPTAVAAILRETGRVMGDQTVLSVVEQLHREWIGAGPLEALLYEPGVTDVVVNGDAGVFIDCGEGLQAIDMDLGGETEVRRMAQRLAAKAGRRLDDAAPFVDARLADGTRLHAVLAPVARPGTLVSLRVPPRRSMTLDDLVEAGSLEESAATVLRQLIESRAAFIVSGGAGAGKTTLLATLLGLVDPRERMVVVEDSTELRPEHPHVVGLEARTPNVEGAGAVTMQSLVRQALRMRPDRLIVGEVRGAEVVDLLAALNTGHEGGAGTIHANSVRDVPARFEALGMAAGMSREAVHSQVASALDVVVHMRRNRSGQRQLASVAIAEQRDGPHRFLSVLSRDGAGVMRWGEGRSRWDRFVEERI